MCIIHQIRDFIKGLGVDQFCPEVISKQRSSAAPAEKPFKAKESAALKPTKNFQKPVNRDALKSQGGEVAEPKSKKILSKQSEDSAIGLKINLSKPQNKKILFDETYIVGNQPLPDTDKDKAWYNLLINPDTPWYQQGKKLKSDSSKHSPEEDSECEAERKRYVGEDTANFLKGILIFYLYCLIV